MTQSSDLHLDLLDQIQIASPCTARWEEMEGDEKSRLCGQCSLKVHDLAAMSRDEAEALIATATTTGERLCARLYRRVDGTVLTADCPVGLAAIARRARDGAYRFAAAVFALGLLAIVTTMRAAYGDNFDYSRTLDDLDGIDQVREWLSLNGRLNSAFQVRPTMGVICPPPLPLPSGANGSDTSAGDPEGRP